eukprot:COSAG02_NODE_3325_length_6935_cov_28.660913_6_plen_83_part_00
MVALAATLVVLVVPLACSSTSSTSSLGVHGSRDHVVFHIPSTMRAVQSTAPGCSAPDFGCVGVINVFIAIRHSIDDILPTTG